MAGSIGSRPVRDKVRAYRARLRQRGLRPIQIWVPDVRSPGFAYEAHRQSLAVARSPSATMNRTSSTLSRTVSPGRSEARSGPPRPAADYAGKPRPLVIIQDDRFDATALVTICAMTTDPTDAPLFRLVIEPGDAQPASGDEPPDGRQDHHHSEGQGRVQRIGSLEDEDVLYG